MKKETFVKLMKLCESYYNKCNKFGKRISDAYIEAGLERGFATEIAYAFPYGPVIDDIVKAVSVEFADDNYTVEQAEDFINWWIWECGFGKETCMERKENGEYEFTPMAEVMIGDKTYIAKTPLQLYNVIINHKKYLGYEKIKKHDV